MLSLRAWNPWALLQELGANGDFVSDRSAAFGPLTFRLVGFVLAGLFALVVFVSVYRRPTADQLALGLAAISLAAFIALTTMHERYAYPALVFLLFALGRPAIAVAWVAFAVTFLLNLVVAVPPEGWVIPEARAFTIVGSIAMTVIALWVLILLASRGPIRGEPGCRSRSSRPPRTIDLPEPAVTPSCADRCARSTRAGHRRNVGKVVLDDVVVASSRSASSGSQRTAPYAAT